MIKLSIGELKTNFSIVLNGISKNSEQIIATKYAEPFAKIIPFQKNIEKENPLPGSVIYK